MIRYAKTIAYIVLGRVALVAIAAASLAQSTNASHDIDVNGVKLGMSLEQARQLIGNTFKFRIDKFSDPGLQLLSAVNPAASPISETWVVEAVNGKVAFIQHARAFPPGSQPDRQVTHQKLVQKYGPHPPTPQNAPSTDDLWFLDQNGHSLTTTNRQQVEQCLDTGAGTPPVALNVGVMGRTGRANWYPVRFHQGCPVTVISELDGAGGPNLLAELQVTLIDQQPFIDELKHWNSLKDEEKREQLENARHTETPL